MKKTIILLGDSITQGLGSKKINFTAELQKLLGDCYHVENMALTGTTIQYAEEILPVILEKKPQYVVIVYGNVDAQIRPSRSGHIFKHIPKRFQKNGMLMPRPFYSHVLYKKIVQRMENALRSFYSKLIYVIDGSEQWVDVDTFTQIYRKVVKELKNADIQVIACSTVALDDCLFSGSKAEYVKFNASIQKIASAENIQYIRLYDILNDAIQLKGWNTVYCYDHFHPNEVGYGIIAKQIANEICGESMQ